MEQVVNINDIKKRYPDEWILLGNPTWDNHHLEVLSGIPLYHSKDKKEVCYLGRPLIVDYNTTALIFNRTTPRRKRSTIGIFKRVGQ
jgi:hypothetical protein